MAADELLLSDGLSRLLLTDGSSVLLLTTETVPDPNPVTLSMWDSGHTLTIRDTGHTLTLSDSGHTLTGREQR